MNSLIFEKFAEPFGDTVVFAMKQAIIAIDNCDPAAEASRCLRELQTDERFTIAPLPLVAISGASSATRKYGAFT